MLSYFIAYFHLFNLFSEDNFTVVLHVIIQVHQFLYISTLLSTVNYESCGNIS